MTAYQTHTDAYGKDSVAVFDSTEFDRIRCEHTVIINLLMSALSVIETIDIDDCGDPESWESITALKGQMTKAIDGALNDQRNYASSLPRGLSL